jgi:hypothetical protein
LEPIGAGVETLDEALDVFLQPHLRSRLNQMLPAYATKVRIVTKEIREFGALLH